MACFFPAVALLSYLSRKLQQRRVARPQTFNLDELIAAKIVDFEIEKQAVIDRAAAEGGTIAISAIPVAETYRVMKLLETFSGPA